jgi:hypothetical protein
MKQNKTKQNKTKQNKIKRNTKKNKVSHSEKEKTDDNLKSSPVFHPKKYVKNS